MALASQQTAASFLFSMVRIMRPIRKVRDLPLPTTIFFNEDHPPQTATCRLLPLGDLRNRALEGATGRTRAPAQEGKAWPRRCPTLAPRAVRETEVR